MQKLSQQITAEKSANERMKRSFSSQVSQQSSEAKKLSMELSRLKVPTYQTITVHGLCDQLCLPINFVKAPF